MSYDPRAAHPPKGGRTLLKVGIILVVAVVAAYSIVSMVMQQGDTRTVVAWDAQFGTLEERLERYPQRSQNREALELERLTRSLGISLSPQDPKTRRMPVVDDPDYREIKDGMDIYIRGQLARTDGLLGAPPRPVSAYLSGRAAAIDAVREFLLTRKTPYWNRDVERVFAGPFYNPPGHRQLHSLLLADALAALAEDDSSRALDDLESSWNFLQALRGELYVNTLSFVFRVLQRQAAVLRLIDEPGAAWHARMDPRVLRDQAFDALAHYGWVWAHLDDTIRWDPEIHIARRLAVLAIKPYVQLCEIDTIADYKPNLQKLMELDYLCDRDLPAAGVNLDWPAPWWNEMSGRFAVSVKDFVDIWSRLEFDLEATRKWLDLSRAADTEVVEASDVCPDDRWLYTVDANGDVELSLSREVRWSQTATALAPAQRLRRRR